MEYPKRKHPRLKNYDYSLPGYYYVTIHAEKERPAFSRIRKTEQGAEAELTSLGQLLAEQRLSLERRFLTVKIDKYVIMPNPIHLILVLTASGGPDLTALAGAFKSLSAKKCNALLGIRGERLFQQNGPSE